jgi:hypothetical protein
MHHPAATPPPKAGSPGRLPRGRELVQVGPVVGWRLVAVAQANALVHAPAPVRRSGLAERCSSVGHRSAVSGLIVRSVLAS